VPTQFVDTSHLLNANQNPQILDPMTISLLSFVHPVMSHALAEAEQKAKDGILEALPGHRTTALRPEENTSGPLTVTYATPPTSPKEARFLLSPPPPPSRMSPSQEITTPSSAFLTFDAEFRIIEAELANCALTREALVRREAVLRERKAEIVRETKMRLDKEVRELTAKDQDEKGDEGVFMREVQRRVDAKLKTAEGGDEACEDQAQPAGKVEEKRKISIQCAGEEKTCTYCFVEARS
jgi:hypothetical protein